MRLLCFSDIHGSVDAVETMLGDVERRGASYDAYVFAGDLTNLSSLRKTEKERIAAEKLLEQVTRGSRRYREFTEERNERFFEESKRTAREILALIARQEVPLYYIFGNRDRLGKYDLAKEKGLSDSKYTICLEHVPKASFGDISMTADEGLVDIAFTANEKLVDERTILVRHAAGGWRESYKAYRKALLNISGHTHQAMAYKNFLDVGFLYRDETRGAVPMMGGYFDVEISDGRVSGITFNNIGGLVGHDFVLDGIPGKVYSVHKSYFPFRLEFI